MISVWISYEFFSKADNIPSFLEFNVKVLSLMLCANAATDNILEKAGPCSICFVAFLFNLSAVLLLVVVSVL